MAIPERYNTGYNIGVGGAVVRGGQLLLVRRASRHGRGNWQLPGGFIEPDETIEQAVVREVQEEAGVTAEVERAEAAGAGLILVTVRVPGGFVTRGQVPLVLTVGSASAPPVAVWLE